MWIDFKHALRALRRTPGFTLVALLTLGLGIGGTTAMFSVVDAVVLRPLPYPDAHRVVAVQKVTPEGEGGWPPADFLDVQRETRAFAALAAYREDVVDLVGRGDPVRRTLNFQP